MYMKMKHSYDFLILGSGIAGLSFALKASQLGSVAILTKTEARECATHYAQGGIASVRLPEDSFQKHMDDTLVAGAGLCNSEIVKITIEEGPAQIEELLRHGVPFVKKNDQYDLTWEGGHSARRVFHVNDYTGAAIEDALLQGVLRDQNISLFEHHLAIDLIHQQNECQGVYALSQSSGEILSFQARYTILATGGAGKAYLYTSNPDVATGDGIAMAYRAGARVANLEFMQFHPTCLYHPQAKSFLISEAVRGEGAEVVNADGRAFLKDTHPAGSLAPRDVVARAIDVEMKRTGADCVFLDLSSHPKEFFKNRFPQIYEKCSKLNINLAGQRLPVVPAAHYMCGGVWTNEWAETTVHRLFAIGEVACTGLHGANRLASNSLLESVVFANRAFLKIEKDFLEASARIIAPSPSTEWQTGLAIPLEEKIDLKHTWKELRTLMWNYVGIVRSNHRLEKALQRVLMIQKEVQEYYWRYLPTSELIELRNLTQVAFLIIQSALSRKESRGLHFNTDYLYKDDRFFNHDTLL